MGSNAFLAVNMQNKIRWPGVVVFAVSLTLGGCTKEIESDLGTQNLEAARTTLASATSVARAETRYRTYLYSELDADVYSRLDSDDISGPGLPVKAIHAEVGDPVRRGQLLATLEDDEATLQVEAAAARADDAKAHFQRVEELHEREVVSPAEYDAALYAKRGADATLKRAQLNLARTRVRAPFSGVVARRYVRVGELVEDAVPLFRVTAMAPLRARLLVPESEAVFFHSGAPVRLSGASAEAATARVLLVSPTVDPASGTREVIVELSEAGALRPGAAVVAELTSVEKVGER